MIQARSSSTRFPGKIFETIGSFSVLEHVYYKCANVCDSLVIIPLDDLKTELFCLDNNLPYYKGPLEDLVERHYRAGCTYLCDNIVRITSDCLFINNVTIKHLLDIHTSDKYDYTTNIPSCVDGHDIQIFSMNLMGYLQKNSIEREHLGNDITKDPDTFSKKGFKICIYKEPYLKEWYPKLSIDTPEDLERARKIYELSENNK